MILAMLGGSLLAATPTAMKGLALPTVGALPAALPPLSSPALDSDSIRAVASGVVAVTLLALTEAVRELYRRLDLASAAPARSASFWNAAPNPQKTNRNCWRGPSMHDYRRVLALVDFSDAGSTVARRALNLARLEGAELAFLHLINPDPSLDGGYPPPPPARNRNRASSRLPCAA